MLADDDVKRFSSDASSIVVLRGTPSDLLSRSHYQQRIVTETDRHGKRSPLIEIFLAHDPAMFSGGNIQSECIAVVHHHAITTEVDPPFVDVASNHDMRRAQISAAIVFVPARPRQRPQ